MSDVIEQYYESTGARYRMSSTRRARILDLVSHAIEKSEGKNTSILDIGIGSGEVAQYCRTKYPEGSIRLTGIDISRNLLDAHRDLYTEVRIANVDLEGWTADFSQPYDIIVASELVEHLFRPDIFLKTAWTILKPGGYLVLSTPNMLLWSQRIKFLLGRHGWSDGGVFEWGHIHLFSWGFLQEQLTRDGYRIIETNHLLYPNSLSRWQHMLPPGLFAFQFILLAQKR